MHSLTCGRRLLLFGVVGFLVLLVFAVDSGSKQDTLLLRAPLPAVPDWTGEGDAVFARYGEGMAGACDVNGDGYADLLVGSTYGGQVREGQAFAYYGSAIGLPATPDWMVQSNQDYASMGNAMSAGDVNGDGYDDAIVGVPWYDTPTVSQTGHVLIYHGSASGLATTPACTLAINLAGVAFGNMVASGDFNDDGFDDVLVFALRYSNGQSHEGAVFLYNGSAAGLSTTYSWMQEGNQSSGYLGQPAAGDVNGDGIEDVVLGQPYYMSQTGRVLVYYGSPSGPASSPDWQVVGTQAGCYLGSLPDAVDVNGDGYDDIVCTAHLWDGGEIDEGAAFVYHGGPTGPSPTPDWTFESDQAGAALRTGSGVGDVNGDGYSDVLVAAPAFDDPEVDEGRAWVFLGGAAGLSAMPVWTTDSDQAGAYLGHYATGIGDVNGDGWAELGIHLYSWDGAITDAGAAWVYYGTGPQDYELSVAPGYGITNCSTNTSFTFSVDHVGGEEVRGYDLTFTVDPGVVVIANTGADVSEENYLSSVAGTAFYTQDNGGGSYTVSCAILGGTTGAVGAGDLFTVDFTPVAEGTSAIAVTSFLMRDVNNVPLPTSMSGGTVQVDCTVPTMEWPLAEAENECTNTAPVFSNFGFDDDVNLDLAEYQIDALGWNTIFSGIDATEYNDDGWVLPGFAGLSEGSHTVAFHAKDDAGNVNGEGTPDTYTWSFIKDTVAPSPPADFVALPGHDKVHLTWTNPTGDASFIGVEIRRVAWGDYPQYGTPGPAAPAYPADETEGALVTQTALEAIDDDPRTPRDIYYYAAFSYDCAGNYSAFDAGARDRSPSYWLGDINPAATGDGNVDMSDLAPFSSTFGVVQGGPGWNAESDFGPTDDYSRFGIPEPDDIVNFEDLMIFAMNYGNVTPAGAPALLAAATREMLSELVDFRLVPVAEKDGKVTMAVVVSNSAASLKGFAVTLDCGLQNQIVSVVSGSALSRESNAFFGTLRGKTGEVTVCVAALGVNRPLAVSGEIARLELSNEASVRLTAIDLRDTENTVERVTTDRPPVDTPYLPTQSALLQNHPNPFNPATTITYDVATAGNVRVDVFDVSGRLVRTLVNDHKDAGRFTVPWDGRDTKGTTVHTGIYFYRMTAPGYTSPPKKMLLLK